MFVLINQGKVSNVSHTLEGLTFTTNKVGRSLFYKNALIKTNGKRIWFEGDLTPSPNIKIERWTQTSTGNPNVYLWDKKAIELSRQF